MGINDPNHVLEEWLASLVPSAFVYKLPDGFLPRVIVQDLTALMVAAFHSPRVLSGDDFVRYLLRPIRDFERAAATAGATSPLVVGQYSHTTAPEPLDLRADAESIVERVGTLPIFVYARDNGRFTPQVRRMVHDERYETVAVKAAQAGDEDEAKPKDMPLTRDELAARAVHIHKGRAMPGAYTVNNTASGFEARDNISELRRQAGRTPEVKSAYQHYGAWAVLQELQNKQATPLADAANDERFVMMDMVLSDFPTQVYKEAESLAALPEDWTHGPSHAELVELRSGESRGKLQTLPLGETDLKLAWYAEHLSNPGDHILLRCNDSDVLFLLLLHAERWLSEGRVVFLDMMPQADKRLKHRFVCITELARKLNEIRDQRWKGMTSVPTVLTFLALLCGSDYTRNHYYISANAIRSAFEEHGTTLLKNLVLGFADVATPDENASFLSTYGLTSLAASDWPVLPFLDEGVANQFLRLLYQNRIGAGFLTKEANLPPGTRLAWSQIEAYTKKRFATHKQASKYTVPTEAEVVSEIRRIYYTILYWHNPHLGLGNFPNPLAMLKETHESVWGWKLAPKYATQGSGLTRCLQPAAEAALRNNMLQKPEAELFEPLCKGLVAQLQQPWLVCHTTFVTSYDSIWNTLVADWLVQSKPTLASSD